MTPTLEIVAGPNGSGKSTFAESYFMRARRSGAYLNPDLIASGMGPLDFERASFQAGRVLIREVNHRIRASESFAFESTLSGRTWITHIREARSRGYSIKVYFLSLGSVRKNLERIRHRVKFGGHHIPSPVVRRRYPRCFDNFWNLYRPLCSEWYVFDNSMSEPRLVMSSNSFSSLREDEQKKFAAVFLRGLASR